MPEHHRRTHSAPAPEELVPRRPVWRRSTAAAATPQPEDLTWSQQQPLRCGAEDLSVAVPYLQPGDLWEPVKQAEERDEAVVEQQREKKPDPMDDEDDVKAAARFRNDRYAVKLLREDMGWGSSTPTEPGMLG